MAELTTNAIRQHLAQKQIELKTNESKVIELRQKIERDLPRQVRDTENEIREAERILRDAENTLRTLRDTKKSQEEEKWKAQDELKRAEGDLRRSKDATDELKRDLEKAIREISQK